MDKNCWFNLDNEEIQTDVNIALGIWRRNLRDPGHSMYQGFGSMEKLVEYKTSTIRKSIITRMNEAELLKRSSNSVKLDDRVTSNRVTSDKLDKIEKLLHDVIEMVRDQKQSCSKMDDHINFIEDTYETLRSPLDYVTTQVNRLRGVETNDTLTLPNIRLIEK
jgi:archaellum component FlaC